VSREFKPGDVAMLMTEGGERIGFRCGVESNMGWEYAREPGQKTWSSDTSAYAKPIRPLVVIDPEDREQVERLARAIFELTTGEESFGGQINNVQAALREVADPKPDEPTGLGAVVEDGHGERWVRVKSTTTIRHWRHEFGGDRKRYADIGAVRVLSEGVLADDEPLYEWEIDLLRGGS
jgi:hypothetical protein